MSANLFLQNSYAVSYRAACSALIIFSLPSVTLPTTTSYDLNLKSTPHFTTPENY
jgi:hypothetical protein